MPDFPTFQWHDTQAGDRADAQAEQARLQQTPLSAGIGAAWRSESLLNSTIDRFYGPQYRPDPNYRLTPERVQKWQQDYGVPPQFAGAAAHATSDAHLEQMGQSIRSEMQDANTLDSMGWGGAALRMGVSLVDPPQLVANILSGGAGAIGKAGLMSRIVRGGLAAAGTNTAIEAALGATQYTRDPGDPKLATFMALGIGGLVGGLTRAEGAALRHAGQDGFTETTLRKAQQDGLKLTPEGESKLASATAPYADSPVTAELRPKAETPAPAAAPTPPYNPDVELAKASIQLSTDLQRKGEAILNDLFPNRGKPVPDQSGRMSPVDVRKSYAAAEKEGAYWESRKAQEAGLTGNVDSDAEILARKFGPEGDSAIKVAYMKAVLQKQVDGYLAHSAPTHEDVLARMARDAGHSTAEADKAAQENALWAQHDAPTQPTEVPHEAPPSSDQPVAPSSDAGGPAHVTPESTPAEVAPAPAPAPEATHTFTSGDSVEWTDKKGGTVTGTVKKVLDNGDYLIAPDDGSAVRAFRSHKVQPVGGDEPSIFGADSIGSARVGTKGLIEDIPEAVTHIKIGRFQIPIRFDYYARFRSSENPVFRRFADMFLYDNVGKKGGRATSVNSSEWAAMEQQTYRGRFAMAAEEGFKGHADELGLNWADRLHTGQKATDFFEEVTRAVRGGENVSKHAEAVASKLRELHAELLEKMKVMGVDGAESIDPNPAYMMRRFNHDRLALIHQQNPARLVELVTGAIRASRPDMEADKAGRIAEGYLKRVRSMRYDANLGKSFLFDKDVAMLREALGKTNLAPDEIEAVMDLIHSRPEPKVEGAHPRTKLRMKLDENHQIEWTDEAGKQQTLRMSDLFENDSRTLFDIYAKQTTGLIGNAKMGITGRGDFDSMMREATTYAEEHGLNPEKHKADMRHAEDIYNNIVGRPMSGEAFGKTERIARVLRDVNFFRMMGQGGFAQVIEIGNIMGLAGWRAFAQHIPAVGEILRMAKGNVLEDDLGRQLANLGGFGTEIMAHNPVARSIEELDPSSQLTKIEQLARKAAHATNYMGGMAPVNNVLKNIAGRVFVQRFSDMALGLTEMTPAMLKRMAASGAEEGKLEGLLKGMREYVTVDGPSKKVTGVDWERWAKESPNTYDTFRLAMFRETRRAVQEHTIGETAPWMHGSIGKLLTQFRSFSLVSWNKQFLFGVNHWSPEVGVAWMASMLFGGLSYVAQSSLNYSGAQLDERMGMGNIASAAFQRAGFSSLMPMAVSGVGGRLFDWDPFKFGRTTGASSDPLLGIPTVDLVNNKILNTISSASQSVTTNDHMWTQQDIRNGLGVFPNLIGVRNMVNAMAAQAPTHNYLRAGAPQH